MRKEMHEYYSSYIHNDYAFCILSCYSQEQKEKTEDPHLEYNLWGRYNYAGKKILDGLNRNLWMTMLYFKHIISQKKYFDKNHYIDKNAIEFWNDALIILFMIEEKMKGYYEN